MESRFEEVEIATESIFEKLLCEASGKATKEGLYLNQ